MTNILDIKALRNNTYMLTFEQNGKKKTHVVAEDTIVEFSLLSSKSISDAVYKKIIKSNDENLFYNKAIHYIDYQMRTISEVKKHLKKSTKDEAIINRIVKKLKDQQYLNDNQFVTEYVKEKIEFDLVGPRYIKDKLIKKGIHFDLINDSLVSYTDKIQNVKIQELLKKETKYPIKKTYKKAYVSIKTKLVNKGFSLHIIDTCITSFSDVIKDSCLEEELLQIELQKQLKEYDVTDYKQKEKLIGKLIQKGYDYTLIKQALK